MFAVGLIAGWTPRLVLDAKGAHTACVRVVDRIALMVACIVVAVIAAGALYMFIYGPPGSCSQLPGGPGGACSSAGTSLNVALEFGALVGLLAGVGLTVLIARRAMKG